jgi:hypothetical protein
MTCQNCIDAIDRVLNGDKQLHLNYFRVDDADMVVVGCEKHVATGLKRYKLGFELERQHGGEEKT